jgi:hypothetical protein
LVVLLAPAWAVRLRALASALTQASALLLVTLRVFLVSVAAL